MLKREGCHFTDQRLVIAMAYSTVAGRMTGQVGQNDGGRGACPVSWTGAAECRAGRAVRHPGRRRFGVNGHVTGRC